MKSVFLGKIEKPFKFTNDKGENVQGIYYRLVHGEMTKDGVCYPIISKINARIYDSLNCLKVFDTIDVDIRIIGNKFEVLGVKKL